MSRCDFGAPADEGQYQPKEACQQEMQDKGVHDMCLRAGALGPNMSGQDSIDTTLKQTMRPFRVHAGLASGARMAMCMPLHSAVQSHCQAAVTSWTARPGLPGVPMHGWGWIDAVATGYGGRQGQQICVARERRYGRNRGAPARRLSASSLPTASAAVTAPRSSATWSHARPSPCWPKACATAPLPVPPMTISTTHRGGQVSCELTIASIDLVTQSLVLSRNARCPSLLRRNDEFVWLGASAEAIGIRRNTKPAISELTLAADHTFDCVYRRRVECGRSGWLRHRPAPAIVCDADPDQSAPASVLADAILHAAMRLDSGRPRDDATVVVLKIAARTETDGVRRMRGDSAVTTASLMVEKPPLIKVVGVSASGKVDAGHVAARIGLLTRPVSQEHSDVAELWKQFGFPRVLIFLDNDLAGQRSRRPDVEWDDANLASEHGRLRSARDNADLRINTATLTAAQVRDLVVAFLEANRIRRAQSPLSPIPRTGGGMPG